MNRIESCPSRDGYEIRRVKIAGVLRVAEKDHLLPLDLAEGVVLDDDDLDIELVSCNGDEFAEQHTQTTIADDAVDGSIRIGYRRRNGIGQTARHRC